MKNYYAALGISKQASQNDIEKAFPLSLRNNKQKFEEILNNIDEAYKILSNPEKRKDYDDLVLNFGLLKTKILELKSKLANCNTDKKSIMEKSYTGLARLYNEMYKQHSMLSQDEDSAIIENTIILVDRLMQANDAEGCKHVLKKYGRKIQENFKHIEVDILNEDYESHSRMPLHLVNKLLVNNLQYGLAELDLIGFDKEIKRLEITPTEQDLQRKNKFLSSLKDLKKKIQADIKTQCQNHKQWAWNNEVVYPTLGEVIKSHSVTLAKDTKNTLLKLKYSSQSKEEDKKNLEEYAKKYAEKNRQTPHVKNFIKSVAIVVGSGLSFILSIPFSLVLGMGCPAFLALPFDAAAYARDLGKKLTGLPANVSLSHHLLFKDLSSAATKSALIGEQFIETTSQKLQQNNAEEKHLILKPA